MATLPPLTDQPLPAPILENPGERPFTPLAGMPMLLLGLALLALGPFLIWAGGLHPSLHLVAILVAILILSGLFTIDPNQARVMIFFGDYRGSLRRNGFFWANPFYTKKAISLRVRNLNGRTLKVNDAIGNPVEIAAIVVWQVSDTYRALLGIEQYESFVELQSESALRHLATQYPYDDHADEVADGTPALRSATDLVADELALELARRLSLAGITVLEARISHLAYAAEIAGAMLQRQQATAVVAARRQIVEGAVGMVELALDRLQSRGTVTLDEARRSAMVANLLVVLCSERSTSPVINTTME